MTCAEHVTCNISMRVELTNDKDCAIILSARHHHSIEEEILQATTLSEVDLDDASHRDRDASNSNY